MRTEHDIFKAAYYIEFYLNRIVSRFVIPIVTGVAVIVGIVAEHLNLGLPQIYLQFLNLGLIGYLILELNLPSLILGPEARKIWSIPFVATAAFTYGLFSQDLSSNIVQYLGFPIVILFITTILIIYRTRDEGLVRNALQTQYKADVAAYNQRNPDFEYTSIIWMKAKISARDALLLVLILKISAPLFVGTFAFAGLMAAIENRVAYSSTIESILFIMLVIATMNNHFKWLKTPVKFLARLNYLKEEKEIKAAKSIIRGFANPEGLLYLFLAGTTLMFAVTALSVFNNQTELLASQSDWVKLSIFEKVSVGGLLMISPVSFVFPLFLSTLLLLQQTQRVYRVPRFAWLFVPFPLIILATLQGYVPQLSWLAGLKPDSIVIRSITFGITALASVTYWSLSFRYKNTTTLRKIEKKLVVGFLAGFAIIYLGNGSDIVSAISIVALPSFLWYYTFRYILPSDNKPKGSRKIAILFSSAIMVLVIANLLKGNVGGAALFSIVFALSLFRLVSEERLEGTAMKMLRLREYTYQSALRYWEI